MRASSIVVAAVFAALTFALWAWLNRPSPEPPWPDRVQGMAFSPFGSGQDPVPQVLPSPEQIDADLRLLAGKVTAVRTYSSLKSLGQIADIAARHQLKVALGAWLDRRLATNEAEIAAAIDMPMLHALAHQALGATLVYEEDPTAAVAELRSAVRHWTETDAPFETAEARRWLAIAYRAGGDEASALLELRAAKAAFERLGAGPEAERCDEMIRAGVDGRAGRRVVKTFLFTDIVGSTAHAERLGDQRWLAVLQSHNALVREQLRERCLIGHQRLAHTLDALGHRGVPASDGPGLRVTGEQQAALLQELAHPADPVGEGGQGAARENLFGLGRAETATAGQTLGRRVGGVDPATGKRIVAAEELHRLLPADHVDLERLGAGLGVGLLNGALVAGLRLNALIVTLAMNGVMIGVLRWWTGAAATSGSRCCTRSRPAAWTSISMNSNTWPRAIGMGSSSATAR